MDSLDTLVQHIKSIVHLPRQDQELIEKCFLSGHFKKGALLEEEGKRTRNLYFIGKGYARSFHYLEGVDTTTDIRTSNSMVTAFTGFTNNEAAETSIQCITACDLLSISKTEYQHLHTLSLSWKKFCQVIYEREIARNNRRTRELLTQTAESRYLSLLALHPDIISNVPVRYVASYLGIKPESLSRIRKKVIS